MTPSDLSRAKSLITEYSNMLNDLSEMLTLGAPETLLPASKDQIRQSIRDVVGHTQFQNSSEAAAYAELRAAYMSLANFIPYEEANAAIRLRMAFSVNDREYLDTPEAQRIMTRVRRMEEEAARLGAEFDRMANSAAWSELDDIDTLLTELSYKLQPPQSG